MHFPCGIGTAKLVQQKHLVEIWAIFDQIPIQNHSWDTERSTETSSMFHIDAIKVITFNFPILLMYSIAIYARPLPAEKYGVSGWCKLQFHWGAGALCNFCKGIKLALIFHSFIISDGVTSREIVSWLMKTNSNIQEVKGSKHQKSGFHFFWKSSDRDCRVAWWNTTSILNGFKLSKPPNHYLTESQSSTCQRWPIMLLVLSIFFSVWSTHTIQWQRIWPLISIVSFIYTLI